NVSYNQIRTAYEANLRASASGQVLSGENVIFQIQNNGTPIVVNTGGGTDPFGLGGGGLWGLPWLLLLLLGGTIVYQSTKKKK
ncbi:MAG: hypothetical protein AAFO94_21715, partial [Bacteroidota bacterium]